MLACGIFQVTRMVVSTYQAASGAGAAAMHELELQTREVCLIPFCFLLFRFIVYFYARFRSKSIPWGILY